jgi:hypothetical protein
MVCEFLLVTKGWTLIIGQSRKKSDVPKSTHYNVLVNNPWLDLWLGIRKINLVLLKVNVFLSTSQLELGLFPQNRQFRLQRHLKVTKRPSVGQTTPVSPNQRVQATNFVFLSLVKLSCNNPNPPLSLSLSFSRATNTRAKLAPYYFSKSYISLSCPLSLRIIIWRRVGRKKNDITWLYMYLVSSIWLSNWSVRYAFYRSTNCLFAQRAIDLPYI